VAGTDLSRCIRRVRFSGRNLQSAAAAGKPRIASAEAAPLSTSLRDTDPGKTSTYGRHFANVAPSSTENAVFGKPTDLAKTKNLPRKLHVSSFVKDVERGAALADAI
jgi:hypothetical protein